MNKQNNKNSVIYDTCSEETVGRKISECQIDKNIRIAELRGKKSFVIVETIDQVDYSYFSKKYSVLGFKVEKVEDIMDLYGNVHHKYISIHISKQSDDHDNDVDEVIEI
jgi:hypothetical protein